MPAFQAGILAEWLTIPWHQRHGVRLSFYVFLQMCMVIYLLVTGVPIKQIHGNSNLDLDITKELKMLKMKTYGEDIKVENLTMDSKWNLTLALKPFQLACPIDRNDPEIMPSKKCKKEIQIFCNEDGTDCEEEEVEDENDCEEEIPEKLNQSMLCKNVPNKFQSNMSRQFAMCYERKTQIKPQFTLINEDNNNALVKFCPPGWQGFGQIFWVTKDEEDMDNLLVHSIIHFSYTDKILQLPTIKVPINNRNDTQLFFSIIFDIVSEYSDGVEIKAKTDFPANYSIRFANGRQAIQKIAGLWSIFIDMAFSSNMHLYISKDVNCDFYANINGRIEPKLCREFAEQIKKFEITQEKVQEILEEAIRLEEICNENAKPTDDHLPNLSNSSLGIGINLGDDKRSMRNDILLTVEEAEAILEEIRKKCSNVSINENGQRIKRQIGAVLFDDYTDMINFTWSIKYWDPKKFPIPYTYSESSSLDKDWIKDLNRIYCSDKCEKKLVCVNGGYTDPKDCSKCRCPKGFGGLHCDRYARGGRKCYSGRYYADTIQKHIVISELMNGMKTCHWTIKTLQLKQRILITVYWLDNFKCSHPCDENNHLEIHMLADKTSRGARLCCGTHEHMPYTMMLEPGVDALVTLRRTNDSQRFGLIFETPDELIPSEKLTYINGCFCGGLYNPWHRPGDSHVDQLSRPIIHELSINTETNLIINGKHRFYTQNGSAWFTRFCAKTADSDQAFSLWKEPSTGDMIRIDHIVAEPCVTDYWQSGCKEMNAIWKNFVDCLKKNVTECVEKYPNFRIKICN